MAAWSHQLRCSPLRPHSGYLGKTVCLRATLLLSLSLPLWQGSVVVFSNYSSWTYTDHSSPDFCEKTPMVFAFTLLLIKWLLIPAILVFGCITALCCPHQRNTDGQG